MDTILEPVPMQRRTYEPLLETGNANYLDECTLFLAQIDPSCLSSPQEPIAHEPTAPDVIDDLAAGLAEVTLGDPLSTSQEENRTSPLTESSEIPSTPGTLSEPDNVTLSPNIPVESVTRDSQTPPVAINFTNRSDTDIANLRLERVQDWVNPGNSKVHFYDRGTQICSYSISWATKALAILEMGNLSAQIVAMSGYSHDSHLRGLISGIHWTKEALQLAKQLNLEYCVPPDAKYDKQAWNIYGEEMPGAYEASHAEKQIMVYIAIEWGLFRDNSESEKYTTYLSDILKSGVETIDIYVSSYKKNICENCKAFQQEINKLCIIPFRLIALKSDGYGISDISNPLP